MKWPFYRPPAPPLLPFHGRYAAGCTFMDGSCHRTSEFNVWVEHESGTYQKWLGSHFSRHAVITAEQWLASALARGLTIRISPIVMRPR